MGLFISLEGGDGSGKATQAERITDRLRAAGYNVLKLSFPRYGERSAEIVANYLNGQYSNGNDPHPDVASLPFAIDRYAAKDQIVQQLLGRRDIVVTDRYVASNLAHQGAKIDDLTERRAFYKRISEIEFGILGLPQPDISFVLLVPSRVAQQNVDAKNTRSYTDKKRDIHEADADHLDKTRRNYQELTQLYPDQFTPILCMIDGDKMRTIDDIHEDIWQNIQERLPS